MFESSKAKPSFSWRVSLPEKMAEGGDAEIVEQYSVHVGVASWEPDFFGRIRSLKARALEQYLATEQAHVAGRISLIAGTATAWLVLAADLEGLGLARSTLETQQATLDLIRRSRDLGMVSDLDLRQAESQVETARAAVARLLGLVAVDRNMLDLLVGTPVAGDLLPDGLDPVTAPGGTHRSSGGPRSRSSRASTRKPANRATGLPPTSPTKATWVAPTRVAGPAPMRAMVAMAMTMRRPAP